MMDGRCLCAPPSVTLVPGHRDVTTPRWICIPDLVERVQGPRVSGMGLINFISKLWSPWESESGS
ncbi:hypothetical protein M404DRAFT_1000075 [Pisolithus tinctorius Marx 270]|uniref:Uncharacterized protein n=1 Tax=Pisolithus tinctorius Marx 270 TaxID=870435 RepID=A0A0C3J7H2_PISTI|nr:hypothetical protein M404DRAFT_1000075 [Pisolithus tinctorius Marx 270]